MVGIFILSLDTEIAWGTYGEKSLKRSAHCFENYRPLVRRLIDLLDRYEIPATWAVVGHLFLARCDGHPDLLQPHYAWADKSDSARDPKSMLTRAPWYYGSDVIDMIRCARVNHEIGTHTFTHIIAGDPAVTPEIWASQMRKTVSIHADQGLELRSIVYPRNLVNYMDTLPDYGIIAYRGEEESWYRHFPKTLARACHYLDRAIGFPPPTYDPRTLRVGERLVNLPASQFLMTYDGVRRWIPTASRVRQARLGIRNSVNNGHIYHLWFHPFNLGTGEGMFTALEQILAEVSRQRMRVMTMQQAAEWILGEMSISAQGRS